MDFEVDDYQSLRAALKEMCLGFTEERVPEEAVFDCKLVANELLSNVIQHGGTRAFFHVGLQGDEITISVKSAGGFCPPAESTCADVTEECGRGLFLIDAFCVKREYSERDGIKVIVRFSR